MNRAQKIIQQINELDIFDLKVKPGDVYAHTGGEYTKDGFITVISADKYGFYCYASDKKGNVKKSRVEHSNSFNDSEFKKVGSRKFKTFKAKGFKWVETGFDEVDAQMPNLDDRYQLFNKFASKELKDLYSEYEDKNYHSENAQMVGIFGRHMASGGKPEDIDKFAMLKMQGA